MKKYIRHIFVPALVIGVLLPAFLFAQQGGLDEGIGLIKEGKYVSARTFFEAAVKSDPQNAEAHYYLGIVCKDEGNIPEKQRKSNLKKAIDHLKKAVEIDPANSNYYLALSEAYTDNINHVGMLSKLGTAKNAKKSVIKALEIDPKNIDAKLHLIGFLSNAPGMAGGSIKDAKVHAEELKTTDKIAGHKAFIQIYQKEEKTDLEEKERLALLDAEPENINNRYGLGYLYYNTKRYDEAFPVFEEILRMDPESQNAYYQIGRVASASGKNLDRALETLTKYLTYDLSQSFPSKAWATYRIGTIHQHKNNIAEAKKWYEKALTLDPKHEQSKKALKEIK